MDPKFSFEQRNNDFGVRNLWWGVQIRSTFTAASGSDPVWGSGAWHFFTSCNQVTKFRSSDKGNCGRGRAVQTRAPDDSDEFQFTHTQLTATNCELGPVSDCEVQSLIEAAVAGASHV